MLPLADAPARVRVAGITKLSTVDWPGRLVATVFLQGCPWDCFYCHNPALRETRLPGAVGWNRITGFLRRRRGLLDAVVFSGGEPTLQPALPGAIAAVRELGFSIGLHTAGAYPAALARVLPAVDWVGLDIKAVPERYERTTGSPVAAERAWSSLAVLLAEARDRAGGEHPLDYEVRTTVHPAAWDQDTLVGLAHRLADAGVRSWAVQRFRPDGVRDPVPEVPEDWAGCLDLDRLPTPRFERFTVR